MRLRLTPWLREHLDSPMHGAADQIIAGWQKIQSCWKNHPRLGGGILVTLFCLLLGLSWFWWSLSPLRSAATDPITVEIPYGASLRQVGRDLCRQGIIHNELSFEIYARLFFPEMIIKAGRYRFSAAQSLSQVVNRLNLGSAGVRVTIPEGLTIEQVVAILQEQDLIRRERFIRLLRNPRWIQSQLKGNFQTGTWPEGYLFPDTYEFPVGVSEEEIIATMLKRFEEVFQSHFSKVPAQKRRAVVIMASLVEKEAKRAEERPLIAGVFYNRLQRDYPLQSCATVEYALGTHKSHLSFADIKINSPYNTYEHYGLPPGPIASPGLASLTAAVFPAKVGYLYFVAKHDGGHIFSNTYAEHLRAQRKINR